MAALGMADLSLRAVLGDYRHTTPLKTGALAAPGLALQFETVEPIHRAFAPMARRQAYDMSEMAIVTALQAFAYDKPIVLLPITVASRFQQKCLICNSERGVLRPEDMPGKRVGVRAYTQTTGLWVRAILAGDYEVPSESIAWTTFEGAHLEEYADPPFVHRAAEGQKLVAMLRDGELDAAILGNDLPDDPRYVSVIPEPETAARAWYERHKVIPINHVVVVTRDLVAHHPQAVRDIYTLLRQARAAVRVESPGQGIDMLPAGMAAIGPSIEYVLRACDEQGLLPRRLEVAELFAEALSVLGELAV